MFSLNVCVSCRVASARSGLRVYAFLNLSMFTQDFTPQSESNNNNNNNKNNNFATKTRTSAAHLSSSPAHPLIMHSTARAHSFSNANKLRVFVSILFDWPESKLPRNLLSDPIHLFKRKKRKKKERKLNEARLRE